MYVALGNRTKMKTKGLRERRFGAKSWGWKYLLGKRVA